MEEHDYPSASLRSFPLTNSVIVITGSFRSFAHTGRLSGEFRPDYRFFCVAHALRFWCAADIRIAIPPALPGQLN